MTYKTCHVYTSRNCRHGNAMVEKKKMNFVNKHHDIVKINIIKHDSAGVYGSYRNYNEFKNSRINTSTQSSVIHEYPDKLIPAI